MIIMLMAAEITALEPAGKWQLAAEENYCVLSRSYGSNVALGFQPFFGGNMIELDVITAGEPLSGTAGRATIQIGNAEPLKVSYQSDASGVGKRRVTRLMIPRATLAQITTPTVIKVAAGTTRHDFQVAQLSKPFATMDVCQRQLEADWGYLPPGNSTPPKTGQAARMRRTSTGFFDGNVYPQEARDAHQDGTVVSILRIDALGKPFACRIESAAAMALAQRTCAVALQRTQFDPATNAEGKPIPSVYRLSVRWVLP